MFGSICVHLLSQSQEKGPFKVAKNIVGDSRLSLRPENLKINLIIKYNGKAINYEIYQLKFPPDGYWLYYLAPNKLNKDDESMVTESNERQLDLLTSQIMRTSRRVA